MDPSPANQAVIGSAVVGVIAAAITQQLITRNRALNMTVKFIVEKNLTDDFEKFLQDR